MFKKGYKQTSLHRANMIAAKAGMIGKKHSIASRLKMSNSRKGKVFSKETRLKMSQAQSGSKNPMFGKYLSDETKKKISLNNARIWLGKKRPNLFSAEVKRKMSIRMSGDNNPNKSLEMRLKISRSVKKIVLAGKHHFWKGSISKVNRTERQNTMRGIEYKLWRESVFARDNWICQKYGIKGGILRAHHIQNYSDFPELRTSIENGITLSDRAHREFHKIYGNYNNTLEQLNNFLK